MSERLSDDDVERIAEKLVEKIQENGRDFWIDREEHYKQHMKLAQLIKTVDGASSIFWRAFIGLVVIGSFVMAMFAIVGNKFWNGS